MQLRNQAALVLINKTLTQLIAESKAVLEWRRESDEEDSLSQRRSFHPALSGDITTSKQLRGDLMTLLLCDAEKEQGSVGTHQ
jgi:hypothetical protein